MKKTENYFEADLTWNTFGVISKEDYVSKFVFEGKFHSAVPQDIIDSFETAEYMMAHAYYHYKMYDEALKKMLAIFEMAVKLRCTEMGIELEVSSKKWKTKKRRLFDLIDDLMAQGYPQVLKNSM